MTRLIDADKLIRCLRNDPLFKFIEQFGVTGVIDAQPTVDAVLVRHGKWLSREEGVVYPFWERYTCSACGKYADDTEYCPHCGARMDEE